jgi:hypothetical protein
MPIRIGETTTRGARGGVGGKGRWISPLPH